MTVDSFTREDLLEELSILRDIDDRYTRVLAEHKEMAGICAFDAWQNQYNDLIRGREFVLERMTKIAKLIGR